eukprot:98904_1
MNVSQIIGLLIIAIVALLIVTRFLRPYIYDILLVQLTVRFYKEVLERLDENAILLDVGIGTGTSLLKSKDIIIQKNLQIIGVDYDEDYIKQCVKNIKQYKLENNVTAVHKSIYDYNKSLDMKFDAIYFSSSLMIMPDPAQALTHCVSMFKNKKNNKIYVTQTFEECKNIMLEFIKPLMKFFTTIDFGSITYFNDFRNTLDKAKLKIVENKKLGAQGNSRTYRLIALQTIRT